MGPSRGYTSAAMRMQLAQRTNCVPVHRPRVLAGQKPLIRLIEISDQLSARHDFILLEAGLSTRPGVSRDAASARDRGTMGSLHIPSKRYIPEHYSVVVVGAEDVLDRVPLPLGPQFRLELCDGAEHVGLGIANGQTNARL